MKKLIVASIFTIGTLANAFGGCESSYVNYLKSANDREKSRREYSGKVELLTMSGTGIGAFVATDLGSKAILASTAGVDSTLMSTAVVPFFAAGLFLGGMTSIKIAEKYVEGDKSPSELENINELSSSLRLIKEAKAGEGTVLESFMPIVWREVNSSVSLIDFSGAINKLNDENDFCQNLEELSTRNGILKKAITQLKTEK